MTQQAMATYAALAGRELWNQARLLAYVQHGIRPSFTIRCNGCAGLEDILPAIGVEPPVGGYQLPELDPAPWYDVNVPESKNLAGFLITSVTMSSPYSRTVTPTVGNGWNLGRLVVNGRTIVAHGFIIAKTCCATAYGLRYLTAILGDPTCPAEGTCGHGPSCGTDRLEFLDCCPTISGEDSCLRVSDGGGGTEIYVRDIPVDEWTRAEDFFRRMNGVGVTGGPEIIAYRGRGCGNCGCTASIEFEITMASESPYLNRLGEVVFSADAPAACADDPDSCDVTWVLSDGCTSSDPDGLCPDPADCADDPICPTPALPPTPRRTLVGCGCTAPFRQERICANVDSIRTTGISTLITTVTAGATDLRNLVIRIWDNPTDALCTDPDAFPDCNTCSTLLVSYIPAGGTLVVDGEQRQITLTCNGVTTSALKNVTDVDGAPFVFPVLSCRPLVVSVQFDCANSSDDATVVIERVDQDL